MDEQAQTDILWMRRALELAQQAADCDEVPVGAVIVRDGKEIGSGYNAPISGHDPTAHAEIQAIREAARRAGNYRLSGATLYVTIEPCTMCAGALVHGRVSRLVYGAPEPKAGAVVSRSDVLEQSHLNWRVEIKGGVLEAECQSLISSFFARRRADRKAAKAASDNTQESPPKQAVGDPPGNQGNKA